MDFQQQARPEEGIYMEGILYGVGVGAGDPEMFSLKAARILRQADIVCIPRAHKASCRAYQIAVQAVPEIAGKEALCFDFAMTEDNRLLQETHGRFYQTLRPVLATGKSAAFLTIGDPAIYSTFSCIAALAQADGHSVRTVSGITSFCAAAAACGIDLCSGHEELHIIPGRRKSIQESLRYPGTKVIMKSGRNISAIKEALLQLEQAGSVSVYAVQDCGLPEEKILSGAQAIPDDGYMTTIIVKAAEQVSPPATRP